MQYADPYIELSIEGASSVFKGISQTDKELLDQHHLIMSYRKGEIIISQGNKPKGLICLAAGKAKVYRIGAGNREQIIKMLRPLNYISYRSIVTDSVYPFSVAAIEESTIVVFERNILQKIIKQNPDLSLRLIRIIAEDLVYSDNRIISMTQKHVRGRVAESLLLLFETYGTEPDGKTLKVLLPRSDIAHLSNMTTSNAIRTLSSFVSERLIKIEGRKITVVNIKALEAISESGQ